MTTTRAAKPTSESSAARARVAKLEAKIEAKLGQSDELAWDAGRLFDEIAKIGLYAENGQTLEQYAETRFPRFGFSTLKRNRAVAVRFTRASTKKHGMHKLTLGLAYLDLTPADERPAELLAMSIVLGDGSEKAFKSCTPADLDSAIARLKSAHDASDERGAPRLPRGAGARLSQIETELSRGIAKTEPRPRVTHRIVKREGRATVLFTLHDVLIQSLERVGRALARAAKS